MTDFDYIDQAINDIVNKPILISKLRKKAETQDPEMQGLLLAAADMLENNTDKKMQQILDKTIRLLKEKEAIIMEYALDVRALMINMEK